VIQVVNAAITTYVSTTSSTFTDTGVTATITPKFATSKILVLVDHVGCSKESANGGIKIRLLRGATQILYMEDVGGFSGNSNTNFIGSISCNYLDSPATTSATTYKTQYGSNLNSVNASIGNYNGTAPACTITLMEIAA
jgi:hypothetical protein